ncbi:MAG TPA: YeeE/YedE thiosulfate transporter family protein [Gammaproteobacteria bacterium]|nr:YeeE/YedE thiosulfate transporter family protein [Gammaproteobacteria bacterium]
MRRDADPYLAGAGIGLVLLAAYAFAGRGLGASGAFASAAATLTAAAIGTEQAAAMPAVADYLPSGLASPLSDWLVWEIVGVAVGAFVSAWRAGRLASVCERGPGIRPATRIGAALAGGAVMGVGAKLARGCTSGQGLSGGALLSVGSWIFIVAAFAAAYACAPLARRLWR